MTIRPRVGVRERGARYKELFRTIYSLDKEDKINITGITFWGTHDSVSWLQEAALVGVDLMETDLRCRCHLMMPVTKNQLFGEL